MSDYCEAHCFESYGNHVVPVFQLVVDAKEGLFNYQEVDLILVWFTKGRFIPLQLNIWVSFH